jgi:hypothetical protein
MKKAFAVILFVVGFLAASYAIAQVYDEHYEKVSDPMDRTAAQHQAAYANVRGVGDDEAALPQDERYEDMTDDVDKANEHHFNDVVGYNTIEELTVDLDKK